MKKLIFIPLALLFFLVSCQKNIEHIEDYKLTYNNLEPVNPILGKWVSKSKSGKLYEEWKKENDSIYSGKFYMITARETLFCEYNRICISQNQIYLMPQLNGEKPVKFKINSDTGFSVVFENKEHDFPQKIKYSWNANDSLIVMAEGIDREGYRKEEFRFKRMRQR